MYKYFIPIQRTRPLTRLCDNDIIMQRFMIEIILSIEIDKIL